jgi:hypothetical protein
MAANQNLAESFGLDIVADRLFGVGVLLLTLLLWPLQNALLLLSKVHGYGIL